MRHTEPSGPTPKDAKVLDAAGISPDLALSLPAPELDTLATSVLRKQSQLFHPDRGGSLELFGPVGNAIDALRDRGSDELMGAVAEMKNDRASPVTAIRGDRNATIDAMDQARAKWVALCGKIAEWTKPGSFVSLDAGTFVLQDPLARVTSITDSIHAELRRFEKLILGAATDYIRLLRWQIEYPQEWIDYALRPEVRTAARVTVNPAELTLDKYDLPYTALRLWSLRYPNEWRDVLARRDLGPSSLLTKTVTTSMSRIERGLGTTSTQYTEAATLEILISMEEENLALNRSILDYPERKHLYGRPELLSEAQSDETNRRFAAVRQLEIRLSQSPTTAAALIASVPPDRDLSTLCPAITRRQVTPAVFKNEWVSVFEVPGCWRTSPEPAGEETPLPHDSRFEDDAHVDFLEQRAAQQFDLGTAGRLVARVVRRGVVELQSATGELPDGLRGEWKLLGAILNYNVPNTLDRIKSLQGDFPFDVPFSPKLIFGGDVELVSSVEKMTASMKNYTGRWLIGIRPNGGDKLRVLGLVMAFDPSSSREPEIVD